jgi:hypothetical protein
MLRELTEEEITGLARRSGVRKIAVENFLMSMSLAGVSLSDAYANLALDARAYGWNAATQAAIRQGIALAAMEGNDA